MEYILAPKDVGCLFCVKPAEEKDEENYILHRAETCFVMMNIYPYNNGHLMIAPYRHVANVDDLDPKEQAALMATLGKSMQVLTRALKPEGFNTGMNVGRVSGAGVVDHLHIHVVPRWAADTNFMPVIAETKVLAQHLDTTYEQLQPLFLEL
jgi:ATP adenylyltransferase